MSKPVIPIGAAVSRLLLQTLTDAAKPQALDDQRFAHLERKQREYLDMMHRTAPARQAAVRAGAEQIIAAWHALSEEEKERRRASWRKPLDDLNFDRARDLDERGISANDAWADENPLQSSATNRNY